MYLLRHYIYVCIYIYTHTHTHTHTRATNWTTGGRSPAEAKYFSSNLRVQTGSEAHPASYPMSNGGSFPGGKARTGRDADHLPPSNAEVKNE
jgi:hypothetical protein